MTRILRTAFDQRLHRVFEALDLKEEQVALPLRNSYPGPRATCDPAGSRYLRQLDVRLGDR